MMLPKSREEAMMLNYGKGCRLVRFDENRCAARVVGRWFGHPYQCISSPGHGTDGMFCKQHAKKEKTP